MKLRVGQRDRQGRKLIGYDVFHVADGCAEEYYGRASSLREAKRLAAKGHRLPRSLYDTARAAGHCAGISAPAASEEEPVAWFGPGGWDCAVPVYED